MGWDLVDWTTVAPHKGRKFFLGRQRQQNPSIHHQLKPFLDRCDPSKGDFSALKPSPLIDGNLTKLVGYLCRHVGRHSLASDKKNDPALERTAEQDYLHLLVIDRLLGRIQGDPMLRKRAVRLKQIAAAAENELEKHFCDLINDRLERSLLSGGIPNQNKINMLRDQARSRLDETQALNERELAGLAMPELELDDDALIQVEMAKILLSCFPYVRNYELMLLAELAMLQQPLVPRFARERMLKGKPGLIGGALVKRWDHAVANATTRISPIWQGLMSSQRSPSSLDIQPSQDPLSLQDLTITVCGGGPLPLTALFFHLFTGAAIVLIDEEREAAERSYRLITNLEQLEILQPGALTVHQKNAGDVTFQCRGRKLKTTNSAAVVCDAVMIASLVDDHAKASIVKQFRGNINAPEFLIMRSAAGLSAKLAYDPIPTEMFSQGSLAYCGETVPASQVATHLNRSEAIHWGVVCKESPDVLAIAHPDVVNTTEIYRRLSIQDEIFNLDVKPRATIEDWIQTVETFGETFRSGKPKNR